MGGDPVSFPIILLVGPSRIGKDSLIKSLCRDEGFHFHINSTTRKPRVHADSEYVHLSRKEFKSKVRENFFLDWDYYAGEYYGIDPIRARREKQIMTCGAGMSLRLQSRYKNFVPVYLRPNSVSLVRKRILQDFRGTEAQLRLAMLSEEVDHADLFDHVVPVRTYASDSSAKELILEISCQRKW